MQTDSYILSSINDDLESTKKRLVEMVGGVETSMNSSRQALFYGDISACKTVIADLALENS